MSYFYAKAMELEGQPLVGNHQCVALVRHYAGAPATANWRQGAEVMGNFALKAGTAIATFVNGRYPNHNHGNHAAFFIKQVGDLLYIVDQWRAQGKAEISLRCIRSRGKDKRGRFINASNNADAFFVIE